MTEAASRPKPPSQLGNAGRAAWRKVVSDLPEQAEFDARELLLLREACRQIDLNERLETAIRRDGLLIEGSKGQRRIHGAVAELRQGRLAVKQLLGELSLLDAEAFEPPTSASRRASRAANVRHHGDPRAGSQMRFSRRAGDGA